MLVPALLITWFSYRAAQQTAVEAAHGVMIQASLRASEAADADLAEPSRLMDFFSSYGDAVGGEPDPRNFSSLDRFEEVAWGALRGTRLVKFISFAPISGGYRAIDIYEEDSLPQVLVQNPNEARRTHYRSAKPLDRRQNDGKDNAEYVPHSRPWFAAALAAADADGRGLDRRAWTDVYPSFSRSQLQIAHSIVVRNEKREIAGVLALDVSFRLLSESLQNLQISPNAIAFIVDKNGALVASSTKEDIVGSVDVPRVNAAQAKSALIRDAMLNLPLVMQQTSANSLSKKAALDAQALSSKTRQQDPRCQAKSGCVNFDFVQDQQLILAHALRLNPSKLQGQESLDRRSDLNFPEWRLVIAAPAEDFNFVIREKSQRTIFLAVGLAAVASIFAILFASRLNSSISAIARATVKLGDGQFERDFLNTNFAEFKQISHELDNTATVLQQARNDLLAQNAQLEERVLARTRDLEHQTEEALQAANAKAAFLATMSHEIRTPMNGVIGMTDLLTGTELNAEQRDYVDTIRSSGDALLTIINDILDFSKIESGKMSFEREPLSLQTVIEESFSLVAQNANQKDLELLYEIDEHVPPLILGDVTRVRQIVLNLVSNAVKFTDKGEVAIMVARADCDGRSQVQIQVKDTGIGIPEDRVDSLFAAFTQIDAATTRKYGGTGLGLAISKRLAQLMGGDIALASEIGKGTIFTVTLNAEAFEDAPVDARDQTFTAALQNKRLLLIDDNQHVLRVYSNRLRHLGIQVDTAQSMPELDHVLSTGKSFDIIMIDSHMPQIDGFALATRLKQIDAFKNLPFVLCSKFVDNREQDKDQLFAHYLLKPLKEQSLVDTLSTIFIGAATNTKTDALSAGGIGNAQTYGQRFPQRMLIVDDNPTNRKVAGMMLERLGYQAKMVTDGREAVDAVMAAEAAKLGFDVVWMDLHMPNLDGLDATKIIRRATIKQPSIIAMTAAAMHGDREMCLQAGMDDYVSKPLEAAQLQRALEAHLHKRGVDFSGADSVPPQSSAAESAESQESSQYFDPNRFMAFCEGNPAYRATFIGLIKNMVTKGQLQFEQGRAAWQEGRIDDAARAFHTMRGSLGTLGAVAFVGMSRELESALKADEASSDAVKAAIETLFVQIKQVLDTTINEAQSWLDQQP